MFLNNGAKNIFINLGFLAAYSSSSYSDSITYISNNLLVNASFAVGLNSGGIFNKDLINFLIYKDSPLYSSTL